MFKWLAMNNALVISVMGRYYTVRLDGRDHLCVLPGKMRRDRSWEAYSNPVAVGDHVEVDVQADGSGVIKSVTADAMFFPERKGRSRREDIIAANLDLVLVIQSFVDPMINPRFVDRLAVRAAYHGIPLALCVNKCDLVDEDDFEIINDYYEGTPLPYLFTSIVDGRGLEELATLISGRKVLLAGFSGVESHR
jgi:ribosome biogenesis GTPase